MKKLFILLLIAGLLHSCYDPYRLDYEYSTVAFSSVTGGSNIPGVLYRTMVKDEGLHLDAGIYLAGILENTEERWADFIIDPTLLDGTEYQLMPDNYYTLSNENRFVIPSGSYIGRITITVDSALFVNDTLAVKPIYAIPFRLTETSEDSILSTHCTQILVLRYINHYTGFYDQTGSFETVDTDGSSLNSGAIDNVLEAVTIMLDSVDLDGMMYLDGSGYHMKLVVNNDNTIEYEYLPSGASAENVAADVPKDSVSTSYVSGWESLDYLNDEYDPSNSGDKGDGAYGNWPNPMTWNWVQYSWDGDYFISQSDVYWWTDGGGIQIPFNTYLEIFDVEKNEWVLPSNPVVNGIPAVEGEYGETDTLVFNADNPYIGILADQYNVTTFDTILASAIRIHFIATESQGILEWKVWGNRKADSYEQTPVLAVTPNGTNSYEPETSTLTLNYKVTYVYEDYYTNVSSKLVWRNRIRDTVNEWRR